MYTLNWLKNYSSSIIVVINAVLIYIIYLQLRDSRKPILTTKIIGRDKDVTDRADVLESGTLYLVVTNESKNTARSINIEYQFNFGNHSITVKEKKLSYLNPKEATKILLKSKRIREDCPYLFEEKSEDKVTKYMPKKTLKINLTIKINYNPIFRRLLSYKLEDNYMIEWGSLKNYPRFDDHPIFQCWNKRDGEYYIYKTTGQK